MNSKKPGRLATAATDRRPFFAGRFDDVILRDGRIVVLPVAALSLPNKRFVDHLLARIPRAKWISFRFGDAVVEWPEEGAFMDALMRLWRSDGKVPAEVEAIGDELLNQFIKILTIKAPGAIAQAFANQGIKFGPVKP